MARFRKGQDVTIRVSIGGIVTFEPGRTVAYVRKGEVWLDNGEGNRPSGPFDLETGQHAPMWGGTQSIRPTDEDQN